MKGAGVRGPRWCRAGPRAAQRGLGHRASRSRSRSQAWAADLGAHRRPSPVVHYISKNTLATWKINKMPL